METKKKARELGSTTGNGKVTNKSTKRKRIEQFTLVSKWQPSRPGVIMERGAK